MSTHASPDAVQELIQLPEEITRTRRCFLLHVRPEKLPDYIAVHQQVWSEMLVALRESGWRNYSLFLRPEDGLVVGYFEADDITVAQTRMDEHPVNIRWQAEMAQYFVEGTSNEPLTQYFFLT